LATCVYAVCFFQRVGKAQNWMSRTHHLANWRKKDSIRSLIDRRCVADNG